MRTFKKTRLALLLGLGFATPALWAQTATDVGRVSVEGRPGGGDTGLITQEETPKARSSVNRQHLDSVTPSAGAFQVIELLPGVNSFSQDATGLFGGGIRVRGFAGDQMGLTINGAPVNDSGSFSVFPQEYTDTENLCEVFVTQGSTDTEAPHVGASGGNIGMVTCPPSDKFNVRLAQSLGQLKYRRTFVRVDSGLIGPSNLKMFASYSKSSADKFKGPGKADRDHVDLGFELKPNRDLFFSGSLLYNDAVNNNIRQLTNAQIAANRNLDFGATPPQHLTPVAGTAQNEVAPADGYFKFNANPFRNYLATAKAEWKVSNALVLAAEPYFWYGYGTGGSQLQSLREGTLTTALGGGVRDLNGDGDQLDTVLLYGSSVTKTFRPGITFKLNYRFDNHNVVAGYWYERARHRQTGPRYTFDNSGNSVGYPWQDTPGAEVRLAENSRVQARDWNTISTASSFYVQDTISLLNDKMQLQLGLRSSGIERDFTNYPNIGASSPTTGRSDGFYQINRTYRELLPSLGVKYNLSTEQSVFANVARNFKAPGNFVLTNLLRGGTITNGVLTGATLANPSIEQETSVNLDVGYRYQSEALSLSGSLFFVSFKNRLARAFDPVSAITIDTNVGDSTVRGLELESGYKINRQFALYGSLTYTDSKIKNDLRTGAATFEPTSGKQFPDTPKWLAGLTLSYSEGPLFGRVSAKYTGRSYSTLVNDESAAGYTLVNLVLGYRLPSAGFIKNPEIRLNVDNLFDTKYQRTNSPSGSLFTTRALGAGGFAPSYYVGAPRFASVTLRADFN